MLSPQVWNFSPPKSFENTKICSSEEEILAALKKQLFNHHVSITMPDAVRIPQQIIDTLTEDSEYYRINALPAEEFLNKHFIQLFVHTGRLTALSIRPADDDSFVALTSDGKFSLLLSKDIVERAGFECKNQPADLFHVFVLDLLNGNCKTQQQFQYKLLTVDLRFDIILMWEPNDESVCPSSIAFYFQQKGYTVKRCQIQQEKKVSYNLHVPVYHEGTDIADFLEWLAAFNLQCNLSSNNYISTLNYVDEKEEVGQVCTVSFKGLFSEKRIHRVMSQVQEVIVEKPSSWVGIVLKGFDKSLIKHKGSTFAPVGDHHHVIMLKSGAPTLVNFFSMDGWMDEKYTRCTVIEG